MQRIERTATATPTSVLVPHGPPRLSSDYNDSDDDNINTINDDVDNNSGNENDDEDDENEYIENDNTELQNNVYMNEVA